MKKKSDAVKTHKIGLHVSDELWERFRRIAEDSKPRVNLTAQLELAIEEYVQRHEPKGAKR